VFPFAILILLCFKSDPAAVESFNGGEELPTLQWRLVQTSFLTCLFLDFISWLWTVDREKSRLLYFVVIINGLPSVTYGLLAYGYAPILLDAHGRRLVLIRYVQWLFTTPSMLYLYSIVSYISTRELATAMILETVVILTGLTASLLPYPFFLPFLAVSFGAFYLVMATLHRMLTRAICQVAPDDDRYRRALSGARLFMTLTWVAIPCVWTLACAGAISPLLEETLYQFFDFATKAGLSCMILHSSIQTHSARQTSAIRAALFDARQVRVFV
jgi:sensory rhodopsin